MIPGAWGGIRWVIESKALYFTSANVGFQEFYKLSTYSSRAVALFSNGPLIELESSWAFDVV